MMQAATTAPATRTTRPPQRKDRSVLHEAARLMGRTHIPAEGLVWRVGVGSWVWTTRDANGELASGNAGSELEAKRAMMVARSGVDPRGPAILP